MNPVVKKTVTEVASAALCSVIMDLARRLVCKIGEKTSPPPRRLL